MLYLTPKISDYAEMLQILLCLREYPGHSCTYPERRKQIGFKRLIKKRVKISNSVDFLFSTFSVEISQFRKNLVLIDPTVQSFYYLLYSFSPEEIQKSVFIPIKAPLD